MSMRRDTSEPPHKSSMGHEATNASARMACGLQDGPKELERKMNRRRKRGGDWKPQTRECAQELVGNGGEHARWAQVDLSLSKGKRRLLHD